MVPAKIPYWQHKQLSSRQLFESTLAPLPRTPLDNGAMAHTATGSATELSQPGLDELTSEQAGMASEYLLKVVEPKVIPYEYKWNGKDIQTKKSYARCFPRIQRSTVLASLRS